jgi:hypothetical protein
MPQINVTVTADCIVNYQAGYPQGPANGVLICYGRDVSMTQIMPPSPRGKPRTDYDRIYNVIPQEATEERAVEIFLKAWRAGRQTCGGSFDDAGVGDLSDRQAVLWDIPEDKQQTFSLWYGANYPGVMVVFKWSEQQTTRQ